MSQFFSVGGITCAIVNFYEFYTVFQTGEMYYTYILCSKLSPKHACDAV